MSKRICEICGKEYENNSRKFLHCCSKDCLKIKKEKESSPHYRVCEHCKKEYWWEDKGNWDEHDEQVIINQSNLSHLVVDSKRFCCYKCGKDDVKEKRMSSNIEHHGAIGFASAVLRDKGRKTCLERYGSETYVNLEKGKQTCLEKYGVENPFQIEEVKNKLKEIASQNKERIDEKRKKTCLEKYGVEYAIQSKEVRDKIEKTNLERYGTKYCISSHEVRNKSKQTLLDRYGVEYACMTENCRKAGLHTISKINVKFSNKLTSLHIDNILEFNLGKYSYDISVSNTNCLIEINPTISHSSSMYEYLPLTRIVSKNPDYYQNKTLFALEKGYRCIHVWDWDDEDKIALMLKNKKALYARKLEVREVSKAEVNGFLNLYHLQNSCNGQDVCLGLYLKNELIELMTFGKPRYNKNYKWELLRLCTKTGYKVVGGAERLFKYFINEYDPESVISYCDNAKFTGEVYKRLNMQLKSFGRPSKHWFNLETGRHITDNLLRQRGFSQLHTDNSHLKGENNELLMLEAGYLEIFDCGQSTYVWKK